MVGCRTTFRAYVCKLANEYVAFEISLKSPTFLIFNCKRLKYQCFDVYLKNNFYVKLIDYFARQLVSNFQDQTQNVTV